MIDHNSYNKDNETNYLNYAHREANRPLFDYYRGLIALRKAYPALANAPKKAIAFLETKDDFFIAFTVRKNGAGARRTKQTLLVLLNGNPDHAGALKLPKGSWRLLADGSSVAANGLGKTLSGTVSVPPTSGMILVQ
jgi:pullulanase/glycogen debranching enzyme